MTFAGSLREIILLVLRKWLLARLQDVLRLEDCLRDTFFFRDFPYSMFRNRSLTLFPHDRDGEMMCMLKRVRTV
jgi:hypothetical protein